MAASHTFGCDSGFGASGSGFPDESAGAVVEEEE
jgi:hypothetical protein